MKIYIAYEKNRERTPVAVADSATELARLTGRPRSSVDSVISKWRKGKIKNPRYACVEVEDE